MVSYRRLVSSLFIIAIAPIIYIGMFAGRELVALLSMDYRRSYNLLGADDLHPAHGGQGQKIPKILHRMWENDDLASLPPRWKMAYLKCNSLHTDWEVKFWTDLTMREFIATQYPFFLGLYDAYPYNIQRVDAARYFILYHFGGVYMDLDIRCLRSLDPLVDVVSAYYTEALVPKTGIGLSNDLMFSAPGSSFMKALLEELPRSNRFYGFPYLTVMLSTGSSFLSLVHDRMPMDQQVQVAILDSKLYGEDKVQRFLRHLPGGSWHGADVALLQKLSEFMSRISSSFQWK